MTRTDTNTILYKENGTTIDLNRDKTSHDAFLTLRNPKVRSQTIRLRIQMAAPKTQRPRSTRATICAICQN